jgi:alkylhydroperoxidase family enzyme
MLAWDQLGKAAGMGKNEIDETLADCILGKVADAFGGRVPNLYRMLARNPAILQAFVQLEHALDHAGLLARGEKAVVALEVAAHADCAYCAAVLSKEAEAAQVVPEAVQAVLARTLPQDPRYAVLVDATRRTMAAQGRLGRAEIAAFERRGIGFPELLEIIGLIATFTLATLANNLGRTRIDPEFRDGFRSAD